MFLLILEVFKPKLTHFKGSFLMMEFNKLHSINNSSLITKYNYISKNTLLFLDKNIENENCFDFL